MANEAETNYLRWSHQERCKEIEKIEVNWEDPINQAAEKTRRSVLELIKSRLRAK